MHFGGDLSRRLTSPAALSQAARTRIPWFTNILGEGQRVTYTNAAPADCFYRLHAGLP